MEDRFYNEQMENELDRRIVSKGYVFLSIPLRLLILLAITVLFSAFYKFLIEAGLFKMIREKIMHRVVYCVFELLLLGGFWYCIFVLSTESRTRSRSILTYYVTACIVTVLYAGICYVLFHFLDTEIYSWFLRITLNLCGLRFRTTFPNNRMPYLIAFLVITTLIMMLEPVISRIRYESFLREMQGIPGPFQMKVIAFLESIDKRRYEKEVRKEMKWEKREWKREEKFRRRMQKWELKMQKKQQKFNR